MDKNTRNRIIQSIEGEHHYQRCTEQAGREDEMWYRLNELMEAGILTGDEVGECMAEYRDYETQGHVVLERTDVAQQDFDNRGRRFDVC